MAIIAFYSSCNRETGNTVSAITYATYVGITKNEKTLMIATGLNDDTVKESFWPAQQKKRSGLFGPNMVGISQNGIEELDRVIRSNRVTPEIITNYTKVVLKDRRLDALAGYTGNEEQYKEIQKNYAQIVSLAGRAYDNVIVDVDQTLEMTAQAAILNEADVIIATTTQKISNIEKLVADISSDTIMKKYKTIIALGKYDDKSKYNTKNISRNLLRQKDIINSIPYNTLLVEATQEGKIIDVILNLLSSKNRDENFLLIEELKRLDEKIKEKLVDVQMRRKI